MCVVQVTLDLQQRCLMLELQKAADWSLECFDDGDFDPPSVAYLLKFPFRYDPG